MLMPSNLEIQTPPVEQAQNNDRPAQIVSAQTPTAQLPDQFKYAGFWVRYAAFLADLIILGVPIYVVCKFLLIFPLHIPAIFIQTISGIGFLFAEIYFIARFGATPGKMFFGLKIVEPNGSIPEISKIIMREFTGKLISCLIFNIGFLWVVFDKEKQSVHDIVANTYIISTKPVAGLRKYLIYFFALPILIAIIFILFSEILFVINPTKKMQQSKDSIRKDDIGKISYGLRAYFAVNEKYPTSLEQIVSTEGIGKLPIDPSGESYSYSVSSDHSKMTVYAKLETGELGRSSVWCLRTFTQPPKEASSSDECKP